MAASRTGYGATALQGGRDVKTQGIAHVSLLLPSLLCSEVGCHGASWLMGYRRQ